MFELTYPATLPPPSGEPQWQVADAAARTSLPGAVVSRQRGLAGHRVVQMVWRFNSPEMAVWRDWYANALAAGTYWFAMPVAGRGGAVVRACRFVGGAVKRIAQGNGVWQVSAQMLVRDESQVPSSALFVEDFSQGLAPYTHLQGDTADYAVGASPFGAALYWPEAIGGPVTMISRSVPSMLVRKIEIVFKADSTRDEDGAICELMGPGVLFGFVTKREGTTVGGFNVPGSGVMVYQATNEPVPLGLWHRFECELMSGAGSSVWRTYNHATNELLVQGVVAPVAANAFTCTGLRFRNDSGAFTTSAGAFASVRLG